jgi:hypothetical protein
VEYLVVSGTARDVRRHALDGNRVYSDIVTLAALGPVGFEGLQHLVYDIFLHAHLRLQHTSHSFNYLNHALRTSTHICPRNLCKSSTILHLIPMRSEYVSGCRGRIAPSTHGRKALPYLQVICSRIATVLPCSFMLSRLTRPTIKVRVRPILSLLGSQSRNIIQCSNNPHVSISPAKPRSHLANHGSLLNVYFCANHLSSPMSFGMGDNCEQTDLLKWCFVRISYRNHLLPLRRRHGESQLRQCFWER